MLCYVSVILITLVSPLSMWNKKKKIQKAKACSSVMLHTVSFHLRNPRVTTTVSTGVREVKTARAVWKCC